MTPANGAVLPLKAMVLCAERPARRRAGAGAPAGAPDNGGHCVGVDRVHGEEQGGDEGGLVPAAAGAPEGGAEDGQGEDGRDAVQDDVGGVELQLVEALLEQLG